jgi:putative hydrolase of the HAD superfamily
VTRAVFFDVDFTLIYPGPTLRGHGYQAWCARHGVAVDPGQFSLAVARAAPILDHATEQNYDARVFIDYTRAIIEHMGGSGPGAEAAARDIYREWAACHHFFLYDDVAPALGALVAGGVRLGLISNTHRSLEAFASHFDLEGLISASVSSSEHGYLKPHPSIFEAALEALGVTALESTMVGDSVKHDIAGARRVGMGAVLLRRVDGVGTPLQHALDPGFEDVPVIGSLAELPRLVLGS